MRISGLTVLWSTALADTAADYINNGNYPDVILYYAYGLGSSPTNKLTTSLIEYLKKGGVLIYGTSDNTANQTNILLKGIYGTDNPPTAYNRNITSNINIYQINNISEDPIINGPFGNLSSKFWGEDNSGSVFVKNIPSTALQIASASNLYSNKDINPDDSIIWYDNSHNFAYIGDSVAALFYANNSTSTYPAIFNANTGMPESKLFGHWNTSSLGDRYVYNSAMDLNLLYWALKRAAESGINSN